MRSASFLFFLVFLLSAAPIYAKPAMWFVWESKADGKKVCKQTSPGADWKKVSGPYPNARCVRLIVK